MDGDKCLRRFNKSDTFVLSGGDLVRSPHVYAGRFRGWWVRDGREFTRDLGRPDSVLWSMVECSVRVAATDRRRYDGAYFESVDYIFMILGDLFVPVTFPDGGCKTTGKIGKRWSVEDDDVVTMHRLDAKCLSKCLSRVNWDGFGPCDKALIDVIIERGVAALTECAV